MASEGSLNSFNGLFNVNVELSSRCNKKCWMCGRRLIDRDYPEIALNYGDMKVSLAKSIAEQLPNDIFVQFHNNGESLLHPEFGKIIRFYKRQIRTMDTNGKLIVKKFDEIVDELDTMTISVVPDDPEVDEQYDIVKQFLDMRGDRKPRLIYRCLGNADPKRWEKLPGIVVKRAMHNPFGPFGYQKEPTIPEIGMCYDMFSHLSIDRFGKVSMCVRFDPHGVGIVGDCTKESLSDIWNGEKLRKWRELTILGRRDKIPLCSKCHFWGIPTAPDEKEFEKEKILKEE